MREEKEIAVDAMDNGDMETRIRCQHCINDLSMQYNKLVKVSGLKSCWSNTNVSGCRAVKNI